MANKQKKPKKTSDGLARNPLGGISPSKLTPSEPPASYPSTLGSGRKRRKDALGQKKDYHQGTATLAARVPEDLANKVRERAEAEGLTVNAWLVRLIEQAIGEGQSW